MAFIAPLMAAMGPAMTAISAASGVLGAVGAIQQGNAANEAAKYNAQVQQQQAQVAQDQAAAAASTEVRKGRQVTAASQAAGLENGLELSGTTLNVINQARDQSNLNALLAVYDGSVKATGYRNNAQLDLAQGRSAQTAGYIGAGSALLGGLSDAYKTQQLTA